MKIRFANGVVKECASPTEQKIFKANSGADGWILHLRLLGEITSGELDELVTVENIAPLEFLTTTESGEEKIAFTLDGYEKITFSTIRHAEDTVSTSAEIHLTKGV